MRFPLFNLTKSVHSSDGLCLHWISKVSSWVFNFKIVMRRRSEERDCGRENRTARMHWLKSFARNVAHKRLFGVNSICHRFEQWISAWNQYSCQSDYVWKSVICSRKKAAREKKENNKMKNFWKCHLMVDSIPKEKKIVHVSLNHECWISHSIDRAWLWNFDYFPVFFYSSVWCILSTENSAIKATEQMMNV